MRVSALVTDSTVLQITVTERSAKTGLHSVAGAKRVFRPVNVCVYLIVPVLTRFGLVWFALAAGQQERSCT